MNTYNLTLLVAGIDEDRLDDIYEKTDGAANVELGDRWTSTVGYDIRADTFADAVLRAIKLIEEVPGLTVVRVEPDQLAHCGVGLKLKHGSPPTSTARSTPSDRQ